MPLENDFLPVATSGGANVDSQANFAGSAYQLNGFVAGIANPTQINKIMRQASMASAGLAGVIVAVLNVPAVDDGNLSNYTANLLKAIRAAAATAPPVTVAFSATPVFDASQGSTFEIVLTGNVTSSTLINILPGMELTFIVKEDSVGGHSFVAPSGVPMGNINTAANKTNMQIFKVDTGSNVYYATPLANQ